MIDYSRIIRIVKEDYKNAKDAKVEIDKLISEWNDLFYGKEKNNNNKKLLMKEIAKIIEYQKPSITEPFLSTNNPIRIPYAGNVAQSGKIEKWANGFFTGDFDREEFMSDLADIYLREGTVWTRTGWKRETMTKKVWNTYTMQELLSMDYIPEEEDIVQVGENLFDVASIQEVVVCNRPNIRICRNENIFPDNNAREMNEMKFMIEKMHKTFYEIEDMNVVSAQKLSILKNKIQENANGGNYKYNKGNLETDRDDDAKEYGVNDTLVTGDISRVKIELLEYWGLIDLKGDGKLVPTVCLYDNTHDIMLDISENPMPSKNIPYDRAVYSSRPFSLWGNGVAFFLGENQNVKNGIVRGILDNMALANNGQKFVLRGSLDFQNFQRLKNRERYVMVNKPDSIQDGSFNNIPGSAFNVIDMVNGESAQLSGIDGSLAVGSGKLAKDNGEDLTVAQQKMISVVRVIQGLIKRNIKECISMAEVFLDDEQIIELFEDDGDDSNNSYDINAFRNSDKTKVIVNVATSVAKNQELHQLNMLMQQTNALQKSVPADLINALVARMYILFDMHDEANALMEYKPEQSPMDNILMQIEMQNKALELKKIEREIAKIESDIQKNYSDMQNKSIETSSNAQYKAAQSREKDSKTELNSVNSILRPSEHMMQNRENLINRVRRD